MAEKVENKMIVSISRRLVFRDPETANWAVYTQYQNTDFWECTPGKQTSSGFLEFNTEFKSRMTDSEMMFLVLKYGGKG